MNDESLTKTLRSRNPWWADGWGDRTVPRDCGPLLAARLANPSDFVTAVTGMRRCGKSTLLKQGIASLLGRGVLPRRVWWVDFEDPVFDELGRDFAVLDACMRAFTRICDTAGEIPYLFLDEVQLVEGWHRWVRMMHETRQAIVTVTGSSSKLLTSDLAMGALAGRTATIELWPLSFREYLRFQGYPDASSQALEAPALRDFFRRYLNQGGMPGLTLDPVASAHEESLREQQRQLVDSILLNDVVARHGVRAVEDLKALVRAYFADTGATFTFKALKDRFALSSDPVRAYTAHLEEAYLIAVVEKYDHKQHPRLRAPRKVYAVDTGLRNASIVTGRRDDGRLAETAALIELVRRGLGDRVFWWGDGHAECDLVIKDQGGGGAVQVWMGQEPTPPEREWRGLERAREALRLTRGLLLTDGYEVPLADPTVRVVPLWRWLLESETP